MKVRKGFSNARQPTPLVIRSSCRHVLLVSAMLTLVVAAAVAAAEDEPEIKSAATSERRSLATDGGFSYWFAVGNQILDQNGKVIKFSGVNLNGFDSNNCVMDGLWLDRPWFSYLDQMKLLGFNLIRLNFATTCVTDENKMPPSTAINFEANSDLKGLTVLEILDKVIAGCKKRGLRVILSNIRLMPAQPPKYLPDPGLWFDADHPEDTWINNWKMLVERYKKEPVVVGVDLYNEVHTDGSHPPPVWEADGVGEPYNWRTAAKRAADAVQDINPNLLICLQGMPDNTWWGGNFQGILKHPLELKYPNKLVYEIHDYGPVVADQPWFKDPTFPLNLAAHWDVMWGFVHEQNIGPIWVGEFGSFYNKTSPNDKNKQDVVWVEALQKYIKELQLSWTWFTWGPNSRDTGGILDEDWETPHSNKLFLLDPIMHPGYGPSESQLLPAAPPHGELKVYDVGGSSDLSQSGEESTSGPAGPSELSRSANVAFTSMWIVLLISLLMGGALIHV